MKQFLWTFLGSLLGVAIALVVVALVFGEPPACVEIFHGPRALP